MTLVLSHTIFIYNAITFTAATAFTLSMILAWRTNQAAQLAPAPATREQA